MDDSRGERAVTAALEAFFRKHPRLALAFSGGTDSAYLLYAAIACGCDVRAYYVQSPFQPQFERADARRLAEELKADMRVIELDVLECEDVRRNPENRCYYCKRALFTALAEQARADGYEVIIDGTNTSDDAGDRPGMRALSELRVLSPLRLCGIDKAQVRTLSKRAGLFTWDKPAYACLATRIPTGTPIDREMLARVEGAEAALHDLGFLDFRVRVLAGIARLQLPAGQMSRALEEKMAVRKALNPYFEDVLLDLKDRS